MATAIYEAILPDGERVLQRTTRVTEPDAYVAALPPFDGERGWTACGVASGITGDGRPVLAGHDDGFGMHVMQAVPARRIS